jgi:large subunit ribosomal protein L23
MKLGGIFKNKKEGEVKNVVEKTKEPVAISSGQPSKNFSGDPGVLLSPHVTEKASLVGEKNSYIFKVSDKAGKQEIKKAVEKVYGVKVMGVGIINVKAKKRIVGGRIGSKKGYKKAMVRVQDGQKIEIMPR